MFDIFFAELRQFILQDPTQALGLAIVLIAFFATAWFFTNQK